jgi:transposase
MTLSQDLRLRIVDLVASGVSRRQAARQFKIGVSSAIRFVKQAEELGHVKPKKAKKRKSRLDRFRSKILGWIAEQSDLTLAELRQRLDQRHRLHVGSTTLHDWLGANQITYKKNGTRQ